VDVKIIFFGQVIFPKNIAQTVLFSYNAVNTTKTNMAKSLSLGNNQMLILLDQFGQLFDFYYPYVGLENQSGNDYHHKFGLMIDGKFSWFDSSKWAISIDYMKDTMVSQIEAINPTDQIKIIFNDCIYNEKNIFVRAIRVENLADSNRKVKLFFNQQYEIYESNKGDTAIYDHEQNVIIHYKGRRVFVHNALVDGRQFDDYSVGLLGLAGREGTFKDAEDDGKLSKNSVEHGTVDSVIGISFDLEPLSHNEVYYWLAAAKTIDEGLELNKFVLEKTPGYLLETTKNYWKAWLEKEDYSFSNINPKLVELFKKSLLVINTHLDKHGAAIASGDSDLLKHGWGTYSYVWPRDGALVLRAMNMAGYEQSAKRFIQLCEELISKEGYMLHKYRSDGSLGSSWHPWVREGKSELPIQEDETALVIWCLYEFYQKTKDLEYIEEIYNTFIKKAAEFLVTYIDQETGLPRPTYDLWEEKFATHTFTCGTVYRALSCCAKFAQILGKTESQIRYQETADRVRDAILKYLWDEERGYFVKSVHIEKDGSMTYDRVLDMSSIYAIFEFEILPIDDPKLVRSIQNVESKLVCKTEVGGVCRYEDDYYFRVSKDTPGNPWIITTLWLARYYLKVAKTKKELEVVYESLEWVLKYAQKSGILSEQLNPFTAEQLSATPLIWSHAEFVVTMLELNQKVQRMELGLY
jgi:GH15 family glucan-1,4-alpha-glucosidase